MTLHTVSHRGRVTDVKVKHAGKAGTEIVVGIAFKRAQLTEDERAALVGYYGYAVDARLSVIGPDEDPDAPESGPLDGELERVRKGYAKNGKTQDLRARPLTTTVCARCGGVIGPDPDADFYTPFAGPPQAMHGRCLEEAKRAHEEAEAKATGKPRGDVSAASIADQLLQDKPAAAAADPDAPIGDRDLSTIERPADAPPALVGSTPTRKRTGRRGG